MKKHKSDYRLVQVYDFDLAPMMLLKDP